MDQLIRMGFAVLIGELEDKKTAAKWFRQFAKVFVIIERLAATSPTLTAEIELQRKKP